MVKTERYADSWSPAHDISERNNDFIRKWTRSDSDYILEKNLSLFCPCPANLNDAEFRHNGLICLAEGISWQVCGLNENVPDRLICLNTRPLVSGTVWEGLGRGVALGVGFGISKDLHHFLCSASASFCLWTWVQASSCGPGTRPACLLPCILP